MDETLLKISSVLFLAWLLAGAPIGFYKFKPLQPSPDAPSFKPLNKTEEIPRFQPYDGNGKRSNSGNVGSRASSDEAQLHQDIVDAYEAYVDSDCSDHKPLARAIGALVSNTLKNQNKNNLYEDVDQYTRDEASRVFSESLQNGYVIKSDFSWGLRRMIPAGNQRGSACR